VELILLLDLLFPSQISPLVAMSWGFQFVSCDLDWLFSCGSVLLVLGVFLGPSPWFLSIGLPRILSQVLSFGVASPSLQLWVISFSGILLLLPVCSRYDVSSELRFL
jgi:hypothetical protein